MIQLHVLRGGLAGERRTARKFPISIGRGAQNFVALSDAGVFERHFEIRFVPDGFFLAPQPDAVTTLNGNRTDGAMLKNGDLIGAGLAQIQFSLGALPQRGLGFREAFNWALIAAVTAAQIYLLWRLVEMARS